ncbi:group 1 truncated hemoglobin [Streptomyces sp. NPDC060027]|uniref:group I truncated hemoglobin n=1 Tax=Streptomyces sp. NPDC060027 TaxID=3347040 RepID=UPI0036C421AF
MSIYEQIGGQGPLGAIVEVFYRRVLEDPILKHHFSSVDISRLAAHQRAFLAASLGGPENYSGRRVTSAHKELGITDAEFDLMVETLMTVLRDFDTPDIVVQKAFLHLESFRADVVAP